MTNNEFSLLYQLNSVNRARGYRLYTKTGQRVVDLWLNGGAAVLGHTPPNLLRELKNTASRGLFAPFPHFSSDRFLKALFKLLPDHTFRTYIAPPQKLISLYESGSVKFWRPFSKQEKENSDLFVMVIPGIQSWRNDLPFGLCVIGAKTGNTKSENILSEFPENEILSPVLLAIATRGIHDIIAIPKRADISLLKVNEALGNNLWHQDGIYLFLKKKLNTKEWALLFQKFLDAGFLLPPIPTHPLIIPGELSAGEESKLASLLHFD